VWFGDYSFKHLEGREDVTVVPASPDRRFLLRLPAGSIIRFHEVTSIEPTRFHLWTCEVLPDSVPCLGPVPTSY
jgi:hypothetical protein